MGRNEQEGARAGRGEGGAPPGVRQTLAVLQPNPCEGRNCEKKNAKLTQEASEKLRNATPGEETEVAV